MSAKIAALVAEARKTRGYSEGDLRSLVRSLANALEAFQPRVVTTVEELDALPVETVMLDRDFDAWKVTCEVVDGTEIRYQCTDGSHYYTASAVLRHGPFRIVWEATRSCPTTLHRLSVTTATHPPRRREELTVLATFRRWSGNPMTETS